jgi:hypothetical protein
VERQADLCIYYLPMPLESIHYTELNDRISGRKVDGNERDKSELLSRQLPVQTELSCGGTKQTTPH